MGMKIRIHQFIWKQPLPNQAGQVITDAQPRQIMHRHTIRFRETQQIAMGTLHAFWKRTYQQIRF
jgi:hypothetical protein